MGEKKYLAPFYFREVMPGPRFIIDVPERVQHNHVPYYQDAMERGDMRARHKLKLKPLNVNDPDTVRISEITGKTINDFNGYGAGDMSFLIDIVKVPEGEDS